VLHVWNEIAVTAARGIGPRERRVLEIVEALVIEPEGRPEAAEA
jgi:hypothetical protein